MTGIFAKGLIKSPPEKRGLGHPKHLSAAPIVERATIETPVVDQLGLGSCTGNSSGVGICTEISRKLKLPPGQFTELPSRLFLYYNARALEGSTGVDAGAMISDIFEAAALLGFPPESAWTYPSLNAGEFEQLAKCVAQPDAMAYHRAADQRLVKGAYRLFSTGQELADDIARAIALGSVVVWGTDLDHAFELIGPNDVWPGVQGRIIGGHAMLFTRFRPGKIPGTREYGSLSSWSNRFGDNGVAWVTQEAATSPIHAGEHWIISLQDNFSEDETAVA